MATEARDADERVGGAEPSGGSTDAADALAQPDEGGARDDGSSAGSAGRRASSERSTDGRASPLRPVRGPPLDRDRRASLALSFRRTNPLTAAIRATCFWMAIALPFLYVPLLIAGVETRPESLALLVLLALNALSLLVGHSHRGG